ncbi:MAG: hypothetical protein RJA44_603 [Pseudomonadota bacterium]|jgi:hemolysin activation/secretion protein
MHPVFRLPVFSVLGTLPLMAAAATTVVPTGSGDLMRDAPLGTPQLAPRNAAQALPQVQPEAQAADLPEGLRVRVATLRVSGVRSLPQAEVQALVSDAQGQELDFRQLQALATRITNHYRSQGFMLARAYLPAQKITEGTLEIAVSEGVLGQYTLQVEAPLDSARVQPFLAGLKAGEPLRTEVMERDLLVLNDLPGVRVQSVLRPGQSVGSTDLDVQVRNERSVNGSVTADNYGNRYTGEWRLSGRLNIASPWQFGDSLDLNLSSAGGGYNYGRAAWQTPVGGRGTQLGVAGSLMRYRLGQEFASADAHGRADDFTLYALQPLLRSRTDNLQWQAAFDSKHYDDSALTTRQTKSAKVLTLTLSGSQQHDSGATSQGSLTLTHGQLDLEGQNRINDAAGYQTQGGYSKLGFQGDVQFAWSPSLVAVVKLNGQWAGKNLDSSEKLGLGGPQGVRAYTSSEGSSDEGLVGSVELQHHYGIGRARLFLDAAYGHAAHQPLPTDVSNGRHLSGAGLGADLKLPGDLLLQASLAWRLSQPAVASVDRNPRLWVQLGKNF